eukprot:CAMPEP_0119027452 /NCGR_PEP_ID=MMETSP1176-20130426/37105_1 /TAXON_ID=265551 /ORGANISM="Synedropsis recta cf, Strain CCMP1620" /LENGTH=235 /DNA_ID=CAMNT_0006983373 /DNA_START=108 /DNA_END=815 /DNA_ORIENTATION=+
MRLSLFATVLLLSIPLMIEGQIPGTVTGDVDQDNDAGPPACCYQSTRPPCDPFNAFSAICCAPPTKPKWTCSDVILGDPCRGGITVPDVDCPIVKPACTSSQEVNVCCTYPSNTPNAAAWECDDDDTCDVSGDHLLGRVSSCTCEEPDPVPPIPWSFVLPDWWTSIQNSFAGDDLRRCFKRQFPPEEASGCRKPPGTKTCFFGDQQCGANDDPYPTTKCVCDFGTWSCTPEPCPA